MKYDFGYDLDFGIEQAAGKGQIDLWISVWPTTFLIELSMGKDPMKGIMKIKENEYWRWKELLPGGRFSRFRVKAMGAFVSTQEKNNTVKMRVSSEDLDIKQLMKA